jgi:hypothetical protein
MNIFFFLLLLTVAKAEEYYNWAINGLNIRETPSANGKALGKIPYGQKLEIDLRNQEYSNYYEELFLVGIKPDKSADIKFTGPWLKVEFNGLIGYVFGGYLSRFPSYKIENIENHKRSESFKDYMNRNYKLLNDNKETWDSTYFDNKIRTSFWENGIMSINDNNEKGAGATIIFADMTLNEALLFVKFYFNLLDIKNPTNRSELQSSEHYYGQSMTYEKYEINFPAPDGKITILVVGQSIVISYHGSC